MTERNAFLIVATGLMIFTGIVIWISFVMPGDEKLYALFSGILGNFSGSLFTMIRMGATSTKTTTDGTTPPTVTTETKTE